MIKFKPCKIGIINSDPGNWFSSFQLTILAIAYLQSINLIPTLNEWKKLQNVDNLKIFQSIEMQPILNTEDDIYQLFKGFFQFIVEYNFWNLGKNDLKLNLMLI